MLNVGNPSQALTRIPTTERTLIPNEGATGGPPRNFITKSGLYLLVMESRKPDAQRFKNWIAIEVLPSIERHGCYPPPMMTVPSGETAMVVIHPEARQIIRGAVMEALDEKDVATRSDLHAATQEIKIEIGRAGGRRELTDPTKRRHCIAVSNQPFNGKCPMCRNVRIVHPGSYDTTSACRFDHFFSNKKNGFDSTWPICSGCHDRLDGDPDNGVNDRRVQARRLFDAYQAIAEAWRESPGDQLLLLPGGTP
jgi:prophage antirepressor-like protein